MKVIDADSHVIEPVTAWTELLPAAWRDRAPRLVDDGGNDWLVCDNRKLMAAAHMAGLARGDITVPDDGALRPSRWDTDVMQGGYDVGARLIDMDADGVDIGIVYPTVALTLYSLDDRPFVAELLRAYNAWLSAFCAQAPHRLKGVGALLGDIPTDSATEVERCRQQGHVGLLLPLYDDSDVDYGTGEWDPLWSAAEDAGMPIGFHAFVRGPGGRSSVTEPTSEALVGRPARVQRAILSMVLGHVFTRFPRLRVVSAENEAGWAAPMIERADTAYRRGRFRRLPHGDLDREPGRILREHVFYTIIEDRTALHAVDIVGRENVMWSSDYPHNVSTWPHSREHVDTLTKAASLDDDELQRFMGGNAAALYGL
jgi:predicted TIM-barrel fold metal-dependent hydrolase